MINARGKLKLQRKAYPNGEGNQNKTPLL